MLDFKNYFSPAVFLCGVEDVLFSKCAWYNLDCTPGRVGIPQVHVWTENHTCGEKLSLEKPLQASCNINFQN